MFRPKQQPQETIVFRFDCEPQLRSDITRKAEQGKTNDPAIMRRALDAHIADFSLVEQAIQREDTLTVLADQKAEYFGGWPRRRTFSLPITESQQQALSEIGLRTNRNRHEIARLALLSDIYPPKQEQQL